MILTAQNHARENVTALRVYFVVSGLPGSFSGFLWMGKIDLFGGMVTGMNLGCLNMILAVFNSASKNVAALGCLGLFFWV